MSITFRVLGSAGRDNALLVHVDSGQAVQRLLFDCGDGCLSDLNFSDIQAIDHLFFSHLWTMLVVSTHSSDALPMHVQCLRLFADYDARTRIVYVEVAEDELQQQNRQRLNPVPKAVMERLLDRWEVPDMTEAHRVDWVVASRSPT